MKGTRRWLATVCLLLAAACGDSQSDGLDRSVVDGSVADGLTADGPAADGPRAEAPGADVAADAPPGDGPVAGDAAGDDSSDALSDVGYPNCAEGQVISGWTMELDAEIRSVPCADEIVAETPLTDGVGCKTMMWWVRHAQPVQRSDGSWSDAYWVDGTMVVCHFANRLTFYPFQMDGALYLDIKGLSQGKIASLPGAENHTERFPSCDQLKARIACLAATAQPVHQTPAATRAFSADDGVTFIASQSMCTLLGAQLDAYIALLDGESRQPSAKLCVPDATVQTRNPSTVRAYIAAQGVQTAGIVLVGAEIPPFEIYATDSTSIGGYARGNTDLPYGNLDLAFWDAATAKQHPIYQAANYLFLLDYPTPFAYPLDGFTATHAADPQEHWVGRWLEGSRLSSDTAANFGKLLAARQAYAPPLVQHIAIAYGNGLFIMPGDHALADGALDRHSEMMQVSPAGSTLRVYADTTLAGWFATTFPETTFLALSDHGQPGGVGDLGSDQMACYDQQLPPVVHLSTCYGAAWQQEPDLSRALVSNLLNLAHPPVAITGTQAIQGYPSIGNSFSSIDIYMSHWKANQTLGARQIEAFENNLAQHFADHPDDHFELIQVFSLHSIFGDGTVEW